MTTGEAGSFDRGNQSRKSSSFMHSSTGGIMQKKTAPEHQQDQPYKILRYSSNMAVANKARGQPFA